MSSPPRNRVPRTRVSALTAALTLLAAGLSTAVAVPASAAVVQCSVDYTTNDWGSGFTANVAINNKGTAALNGWTLTYSYTGNQTLSGSGWNGTWS
ncbi:cellulose binding domain-containing protein, partial [Kitasatospora phosalacinea]|uniref:cellulose binding domain-containing protein n=1 Tax=Kitasatospora phosalacinea TaxID=2065 RepID=UPI0035DB586D